MPWRYRGKNAGICTASLPQQIGKRQGNWHKWQCVPSSICDAQTKVKENAVVKEKKTGCQPKIYIDKRALTL
jgi:hypothetical protein